MARKVEFLYIETIDEKERIKRITEILSGGVYTYLKKSGFLREDLERTNRIKGLLDEVKKVSDLVEEDIEGKTS